ncbi:hypothetical protein ABTZ78_17150 [Streptomyces bauhiniae]|uniref:hypothetical protein n=1 Tax=Streptomyces bauhiniae TaxID=2340725 RepID=UPI00332679C5
MNDAQIRDILRPHRDGGPISRLYATGEITEGVALALGFRAFELEERGLHGQADLLGDVIAYVQAVGFRPPLRRWTVSH